MLTSPYLSTNIGQTAFSFS